MKSNGILCFVCFGAGAAIGAGAAWYLTKREYESRTDEEIESVRTALEKKWEKKFEELDNKADEKEVPETNIKDGDVAIEKEEPAQEPIRINNPMDKPDLKDYRSYYEYRTGSEERRSLEPEMIDEQDFGDNPDYRKITIVHTADGYLLDEDEEPIDDESGIVGFTSEEIEDQFIETGEDTVYIRNDDRETYYEVLRSERFYDVED